MKLEFVTQVQNKFIQLLRALRSAAKVRRLEGDIDFSADEARMKELGEQLGRRLAVSPGASEVGVQAKIEALAEIEELRKRACLAVLRADILTVKKMRVLYNYVSQLADVLREQVDSDVRWHSQNKRGIRVVKKNPLAAAAK
jgi:hypothetical protein